VAVAQASGEAGVDVPAALFLYCIVLMAGPGDNALQETGQK